jgi:hypothetical protein
MNTFCIHFTRSLLRINAIGLVVLVLLIAPLFTLQGVAFAETDPVVPAVTEDVQNNSQDGLEQPLPQTQPPIEQPPSPVDTTVPEAATIETQPTTQITAPEETQTDTAATQATPAGTDPQTVPLNTIGDGVNAAISNTLDSATTSGNATVNGSAAVGDVSTGDSNATTTNLTLLQSTVTLANGAQPVMFTQNIVGDVVGDILIDPGVLDTAAAQAPTPLDSTPIKIDAALQATITNNLNLASNSGNAAATNNYSVGDISTGNAYAVANVVNLINSAVAAGQSFIGVVNIYGNLTGDILLPASFVNGLLSASTTSPSLLESGSIITSALNATVVNNITSNATSGAVSATDNGTIGDISSGVAKTNVTIYNLTGKQTVTKNMLLVFVNVLGTWAGLLFDAPEGSTSASIGGGGDNGSSAPNNGQYAFNDQSNLSIINNLNLLAKSGDASITNNDQVGNVTTGNAATSASILNILNSQLSLSDWFGILFINVFGTWHGNLAVEPERIPETTNTIGGAVASASTDSPQPRRLFVFAPASIKYSKKFPVESTTSEPVIAEVAASSIEPVSKNVSLVDKDAKSNAPAKWIVLASLVVVAAGLFGSRYYLINKQQ